MLGGGSVRSAAALPSRWQSSFSFALFWMTRSVYECAVLLEFQFELRSGPKCVADGSLDPQIGHPQLQNRLVAWFNAGESDAHSLNVIVVASVVRRHAQCSVRCLRSLIAVTATGLPN